MVTALFLDRTPKGVLMVTDGLNHLFKFDRLGGFIACCPILGPPQFAGLAWKPKHHNQNEIDPQ